MSAQEADAYIAAGFVVQGDLEGKGSLRIDGIVEGSVTVEGEAHVGEQARVAGSVFAGEARIAGVVEGAVDAAQHVELLRGSVVHGPVRGATVKVQQGADTRGGVSLAPTQARVRSRSAVAPAAEVASGSVADGDVKGRPPIAPRLGRRPGSMRSRKHFDADA